MKRSVFLVLAAAVAVGLPSTAHAQYSGNNIRGDFGLLSGTQPAPGFYFIPGFLSYNGDTLRNRNGDPVGVDPDRGGNLDVNGFVLGSWWVSDTKILGANYGVVVFANFANNALEVPIFGLERKSSTALGDLYVQPINLGWHTDRADYVAGVGVFVPTGRYDPNANDNIGLGMWGFEVFAGATVYLDRARHWNLATTAFFETHSGKRDSDVKVGDLLTLEGGLGRSFLNEALNVGLAYFAQWKVSDDDFGIDHQSLETLLRDRVGRNRVFGLGPEVRIPIATKKKFYAMVNARYLWDMGARTTTQGNTLIVLASVPIPSVSLE